MKKIYVLRAERRGTRVPHTRSAWFAKGFLLVMVMALFLSACTATGSTPTAIPTVSLDTGNNSSSAGAQSSDANSVSASATIVPLKKVELSFANVGRVKEVHVKVGDQVTTGQVLVDLDTT